MNKAGFWAMPATANNNVHRRAAGGNRLLHREHRRRLPRCPAWTCCSSARTICACRWGSTRSTSSRTCTPRRNWAPPRRNSSITPRKKHNIILGRLPVRHRSRGRVSRKGVRLHQRRQRSAPHPDAGGRLREGHGKYCQRKRKELEAPSDSAFLGRSQTMWSRATRPRAGKAKGEEQILLACICPHSNPKPRGRVARDHKGSSHLYCAGAWIPISLARLSCWA